MVTEKTENQIEKAVEKLELPATVAETVTEQVTEKLAELPVTPTATEVKEAVKETVSETVPEEKIETPNVTVVKQSDTDVIIWIIVGVLVLALGYYLYILNERNNNGNTEENKIA